MEGLGIKAYGMYRDHFRGFRDQGLGFGIWGSGWRV